ncbi:hypothetical protein [Novosphingobium sp. Leaf2]|uniref:hypothetical protein n=1 Tax=Novosphingobium sp. Leaf2 TaxID=1735670 RepID=UPI000A474616|nr:hypothetical protein [Novosphingobium sp. Leaf2]
MRIIAGPAGSLDRKKNIRAKTRARIFRRAYTRLQSKCNPHGGGAVVHGRDKG